MPQARQFSREQILECVKLCVEAEEAVKSGRLQDRLAVELLIARGILNGCNYITVQSCIFLPAYSGQEALGVRLMWIQSEKFL